jgi:glutathione S-transferase
MAWVHMVVELALIEFLYFGFEVARARTRYQVRAPATTGNEVFERYFRVQMNTLELLVVFIPSILIFAHYLGPYVAAVLGAVFLIGRYLYFAAYVKDPGRRELGYLLSSAPTVILLVGAIYGTARAIPYT